MAPASWIYTISVADPQYFRTLVRGEALLTFDVLSVDVGNTDTLNVDFYNKELALYSPPVKSIL